jgi:hypothetical protein
VHLSQLADQQMCAQPFAEHASGRRYEYPQAAHGAYPLSGLSVHEKRLGRYYPDNALILQAILKESVRKASRSRGGEKEEVS